MKTPVDLESAHIGRAERGAPALAGAAAGPTKWTLLAYGGLALPLSLAGLPILTYLPAFYAQELHMSAALVGVVFLLARTWDAVSNLLIGWLSDRTACRWGHRKVWVLLAAPWLIVSTWYLCNPPRGAGLSYLAIWVALFYGSWAAIYVPYVSWGTELTSDYVERSRVTSFRETFTMLGNLFFAAGPILFLPENAPLSAVLSLISITVLLLLPMTVLALGWRVRDAAPAHLHTSNLRHEVVQLSKDRVLLRFLGATLAYAIGEGAVNALLVFYFGVALQLPHRLFWGIFVLYSATVCAVPLVLHIARRAEKHLLLAAALSLQVIVYGSFVVVPQGTFTPVAALFVVLGCANSLILILPTSILADIVDHGDATSGGRRSGAYVAVYSVALKFGMAVGVGAAFGLLSWVGFEPGAGNYTPADASNIRLLSFGLPCVLQIPAIFLYLTHPITRAAHATLRQSIESRG